MNKMDWFSILFLWLMIIVQENNCNKVLNRFRREHQIDDSLKKNIKEKSDKIDQNITKPNVSYQSETTEIEELSITTVPPPVVPLKNNGKKVVKVSNEKQEQRIKARIEKLPPSHPLSRAIKIILDEKEKVRSFDDNKSHEYRKDTKDEDNIVKSDNQGTKLINPEIKRDPKQKSVKSSHNSTILINPSNDVDEKLECCDNLNVLTKDLENKGNDHQNTPKVRSLKQTEADTSDCLAKSDKKDFQKKEENSNTKTAETIDKKDKDTITHIELEGLNKPPEKGKTQNIEDLKSHDLDSKPSIDCEDYEYEETHIEKLPHISDVPISQTPNNGVMNCNPLPYYNIPKFYGGNYCIQNDGTFPYTKIQGGTILNSPNYYQQQWTDSFPANNISPYQYTYNSCPAPAYSYNNDDVIRRAWKNRIIHVDAAGMKDIGPILNILAPRTIGNWKRPQVHGNGNTKIIYDKSIQETNKIINADKYQGYMPSFHTPKPLASDAENPNSVKEERARRPNDFIARNGCYWNHILPHQINSYAR